MNRVFKYYKKFRCIFLKMEFGKIPGLTTINSFIYEKLRPKGVILINIQGNKMYVDANDKDIVPHLLKDDIWEEEKYETELFKRAIKPGMIVVDIGANIGYYTLIAAKLVGNKGRVYAFEPEPNNYRLLYKNIEANNYSNIIPIQKAVSNKYGKAKLWFEKDWIGSPSFSKKSVLTVSKHKTLERGGFVEVETLAIDEFFEDAVKNTKVDIIKIDAEGAEGLIADGAERILKNNDLKIFMEFWPDAIRDLGIDPLKLLSKLQKYGFKINFIDEKNQSLWSIERERAKAGIGFNLFLEK